MQKILIVGGVAAGATAAARLRRLSEDVEITVLEAGPDVSFANCGLPYFIGGDIENRSSLILQSPESFLDQYNVVVHTETEVLEIDPYGKNVRVRHVPTDKQKTYDYDKLILAQGGKPIIPPIPGAALGHVFSLWTLSDMDRIEKHITDAVPETAAVVGGGFIGLEMVEALTRRGIEVHLVEKMPHVMPNMDPEIAGYLQEELAAYGVSVHTSKAVVKIEEGSVTLDSGEVLRADMVLLSVGVRPTLTLAQEAGLRIGEAGGLLVDETLKTSDPDIYAAGDMVEIEHVIQGKKVRIPLAGPANRQGRIAASNVLGQSLKYRGSLGTSVVRVFEAVAGSSGLNLAQAKAAGFDAQGVVVHKEHHTSYYPGSTPVTVFLVYDRESGRILGGQTAGYNGADKRLDVIATAAAGNMTVHDLAQLDLSYSPPIGTANDALNMAAFTAENRMSGYSPSFTAGEIDAIVREKKPFIIDLRDYFAYEKAHVKGAEHIPDTHIKRQAGNIPKNRTVLVYDKDGKYGHRVLRYLVQNGFNEVYNVSGGFTSLERYARAAGFVHLHVPVIQVQKRHVEEKAGEQDSTDAVQKSPLLSGKGPLVIDVRTPEEVAYGAYPDAVNIPLDELGYRAEELGEKSRPITVYCATGARSAYAARMLSQMGFSDVKNGGGLMDMMSDVG